MQARSHYHESTSCSDASWEISVGCNLTFHTAVPQHQYETTMEQIRDFETKLRQWLEQNKPPLWDEYHIRDRYGQV